MVADYMDGVQRLHDPFIDWPTIDVIDQRTQQRIARQNEQREHDRLRQQSAAREGAHRGGTPESGGSVQATDVGSILQNDARSEKPYPGNDVSDDAGRTFGTQKARSHIRECRGSGRDQCRGSEPRRAVAPLPFEADQSAQYEGGREGENGAAKGVQFEHQIPVLSFAPAGSCSLTAYQ